MHPSLPLLFSLTRVLEPPVPTYGLRAAQSALSRCTAILLRSDLLSTEHWPADH